MVPPRPREVVGLHAARPATDGDGVRLRRVFADDLHRQLDPFLLLDEFEASGPGELPGFPDHPHRGFCTLTYLKAGRMRHRDSQGNTGEVRAGGVQFMKAARGVIHSEMPAVDGSGRVHGFQLWLNLPADEKMDEPEYLDVDDVPRFERADGLTGRVVAGDFEGRRGPVQHDRTRPRSLDLRLGGSHSVEIDEESNALLYVYGGTLAVGDAGTEVRRGELAVLGAGATVSLRASGGPVDCLLLSGRALGESIVAHGPFVMNTREQIAQAFEDYRSGRFTR